MAGVIEGDQHRGQAGLDLDDGQRAVELVKPHALLADSSPVAARVEDQVRSLHPLGRAGRPAEVADAIRYLLSDEASFINGAILAVDGGRSALGPDPEQVS